MIPDMVFAILCTLISGLNASAHQYYDPGWMCRFQAFYLVWTTTAIAWLNAVIGFELHYMLWSSFRCIRYQPPTRRRATRNSLIVYVWATLMACWSTFGHPKIYRADLTLQHDLVCLPVAFNTKTMLFLWFLFLPLATLLPFFFTVWVVYDVYRNDRLPHKGQRRTLAIYFFRIWIFYALMRMPGTAGFFLVPIENTWITWALGIWGHAQVLVVSIVSLCKPDVALAVRELFTCQRTSDDDVPMVVLGTSEACHETHLSHEQSQCALSSNLRSSWTIFPTSQRSLRSEGTKSHSLRRLFTSCTSAPALDVCKNDDDAPRSESETSRPGERYSIVENYEDVPKQSDLHYQFDDELDESNIIAFHIEEEADETDLPVCPFDSV